MKRIMDDWITTSEASRFSGYHPEHLRRLIRSRKIRARKFGIVWQVSKTSLSRYLEEAEKSEDKRHGPKKV